MTLKTASINAHGLRDSQQKKSILQWITEQHFDIIFLQETFNRQKFSFDCLGRGNLPSPWLTP